MLVKNLSKLDTLTQAIDAQKRLMTYLEDRPEVQGIGITQTQELGFGLEVHLSSPLQDDLDCYDQFQDIPIEYEIVGEIRAA